ncbi:hypothetical protein [Pseudoalteromonas lipolytica]|uniref:hypothetical protein n=1 Tax=Pseudoalteromonas lipolytica TaxID=570156 RepID=UPI0030A4BB44
MRINIFDVLFYYFIILVWTGVALNSFASIESFYAFITTSLFLLSLYLLKKNSKFSLDLMSVDNRVLNTILAFSICVFVLFYSVSPYGLMESIKFHALDIDKYELRVSVISVPLYWMYEGVIKLLGCVAIIYALKDDYLKSFIAFSIYSIFYILSVQKYPIGILFLVSFFSFLSFRKISKKIFFILSVFVFFILLYFYTTTFKEFKIENFSLFYTALINRLSVTSELVLFVYNEFISQGIVLGGGVLPERLFFIFDLTLFSDESIRLPALVMKMKGGDFGGANSAFYTEGIAGFGVGFDILYILLFYILFFILVFLTKLLDDGFRIVCLFVFSLNIVNLVNIQMWSILNSCLFTFLMLWVLCLMSKLRFWK